MGNLSIRLQNVFQTYLLCRQTQLVVTKWPKKNPTKHGPTEVMVVLEYPTGFSTYPSEGGWDDQDYLTTRYLFAALEGEQSGVKTKLGQSG